MSKLQDFMTDAIGIVIENKRSGLRAIDPKVPDDVAQNLSFNQIVTGLEKIDPMDRNAGAKAEVYGLIFIDKLKRREASSELLEKAVDATNYYAFNITDRNVRGNQFKQISDIAKIIDPSVGTFKAKLKDSLGLK